MDVSKLDKVKKLLDAKEHYENVLNNLKDERENICSSYYSIYIKNYLPHNICANDEDAAELKEIVKKFVENKLSTINQEFENL